MDFEQMPGQNSPEEEQNENLEIKDTVSFDKAIESGQIDQAEAWLMENLDRGDARWLDHRSYSIFKARRVEGDFAGAKKMVEHAKDEKSKQGRIEVLEKESGKKFEEI